MKARISITITAAVLALTAGTVTAASAATAAHTATPAQATCQAFAAWERHESTANLGRLVIASAGLGRSYLKADAGQLYADASSPSAKAGKYVSTDREYVTEDCAKL